MKDGEFRRELSIPFRKVCQAQRKQANSRLFPYPCVLPSVPIRKRQQELVQMPFCQGWAVV